MLKSPPRPLHRSEDDGNLLRPARPLPVQRGLLHPGEAAPGLLAAEDRHHLGSSAGAQPGTWSPEAATFLAVSPLLPSILLAKQVGSHRIRRDRLRAFEFRDPRYSSLPWSCPRPPGPEPLPLLQASPLVYQVLTLFVRIFKNLCFQPRPTSFQQRRSVPNIKFSMARSHVIDHNFILMCRL